MSASIPIVCPYCGVGCNSVKMVYFSPTGARVWEDSWASMVAEWSRTSYYHRKEPVIYVY